MTLDPIGITSKLAAIRAKNVIGDRDSLPNASSEFSVMLDLVLEATESQFGFLGYVLDDPKNADPFLRTLAISNIAWDKDSTRLYTDSVSEGGMEFRALDNLFGYSIRTKSRVISNCTNRDPRSGGLPPGHPEINAFSGIPLMIGEQMIGMIGIANRPSGYDDDFLDSLEPLWDLLALNVHAARAEVLIDQANLAQRELNRLNIEKTSLIESLLGAQEKHRYLTSLDLHDGPAQTLASASMFLSALYTEIEEHIDPKSLVNLTLVESLVNRALNDVQRIMVHFRPPDLDGLGFVDAVKRFLSESTGRSEIDFNYTTEENIEEVISGQKGIVLFRVIQESVNNSLKHSGGSEVSVTLSRSADRRRIKVLVEDNGKGFNLDDSVAHGNGIQGMRERVSLISGSMVITSPCLESGKGTRVEVEVEAEELSTDTAEF